MREWFNGLIRQMVSDKKKLSIMLCAVSLGLLLWGRLLLQGVPRTATAGDATAADIMPEMPDNHPATSAPSNQPLPVIHVDLPGTPGRDLFGIDPSRYKLNLDGQPGKSIAKSPQVTPDEDPRKLLLREEAGGLRLESVVTGMKPRAYISGRLLAPGDEYEGFTLIQVTDRYVILTKYGLFIRLRM